MRLLFIFLYTVQLARLTPLGSLVGVLLYALQSWLQYGLWSGDTVLTVHVEGGRRYFSEIPANDKVALDHGIRILAHLGP